MSDRTFDRARDDPAARRRAIECLWQLDAAADQPGRGQPRRANLYAILDAARDPRVYEGLRQLSASEPVMGLYQGPTARELAGVAPYLVSLGVDDRVFDWLWRQGWGESWGIFFWSLVSMETLRSHFRRLTIARGPEGQRMLFRFYDPRVLRTFLPLCDAEQARELFGPVARYMVEDDDGATLLVARVQEGRVVVAREKLLLRHSPPPIKSGGGE